ncbi:MAG TPA: acyl-CoA dehydrogenase family protein, partial [Nocardioides sp.]
MTTPTIENTVRPGAEATDEEFRLRMRAFLADNAPGKRPRDPAGKVTWTKSWHATLFDNGYAGPSWPVEHGGMALDFARQVIYQEEIARAKVPGPLGTGLGIVAPTIISYGSPDQQARWLPSMLRADK